MRDERFIELIGSFPGKRVAVIGDFILDEYLIGDTKRVSREAPVVVIDYRERVHHPGGAANAAQNVSALGARAWAVGVVGSDNEGEVLKDLLQRRRVDVSGIVTAGDVSTAVKMRILAGDLHAQKQQVARVDRAYRLQPESAAAADLLRVLDDALKAADAVLISDYGMGVVPGGLSEKAIASCASRGLPVVVDSRFDLLSYRGATTATPNEVEVFHALELKERDDHNLSRIAERVSATLGLRGLIITRGSEGMFVYTDGRAVDIGIVGNRDATDVTGAGDTVAAAVTLSLAAGASIEEAAEMATYGAAVVVMKRGTATPTAEEIRDARRRNPRPERGREERI